MSSLDAVSIDDEREEYDNTHDSYKQFHYVDDSSPFKNVLIDVSYIKDCIDTLTNEELEQVIAHCSMLIERNTVAEALGIPSAKLNQFVKAYNDGIESVLGEL